LVASALSVAGLTQGAGCTRAGLATPGDVRGVEIEGNGATSGFVATCGIGAIEAGAGALAGAMADNAGFDARRASCTRLSSIARPRIPATPTIVAIAAGHTDRLGLELGLRCGVMTTGETSNGSSGSGFLITGSANVGGRDVGSGVETAATCCLVGP
jgi:hypothetical protein